MSSREDVVVVVLPLHTQTVIACIWDFDRTLIRGYSQDVLFSAYDIDGPTFWDEVNHLPAEYKKRDVLVAKDTAYLGHMITYAQSGRMSDLSNAKMRDLGASIPMNPGIPAFLDQARELVLSDESFSKHGITVEHYVVSTGVRALIEGSAVGARVDGIWANDFIEAPLPPGYRSAAQPDEVGDSVIAQVGYMIDNTSKTRAIFEINKGVNKLSEVDVNTLMSSSERRVPIENMIYIADGPSDIPVFSVMNQFGGHNLAVYSTSGSSNFDVVKSLQDQGRVQMISPADFTPGGPSFLWLTTTIRQIAARIVDTRERHLRNLPGAPPHVI